MCALPIAWQDLRIASLSCQPTLLTTPAHQNSAGQFFTKILPGSFSPNFCRAVFRRISAGQFCDDHRSLLPAAGEVWESHSATQSPAHGIVSASPYQERSVTSSGDWYSVLWLCRFALYTFSKRGEWARIECSRSLHGAAGSLHLPWRLTKLPYSDALVVSSLKLAAQTWIIVCSLWAMMTSA